MAQQSARRGRKNQMYSSCLEHAFMIWFRSANSHTGPAAPSLHQEAGQMAASDYVPIFFKNRLRLAGRPQMSTRQFFFFFLKKKTELLTMSAFRGPVWSALLQPFHDQSIQVKSVVAVGCTPWLTFDKDIADGSLGCGRRGGRFAPPWRRPTTEIRGLSSVYRCGPRPPAIWGERPTRLRAFQTIVRTNRGTTAGEVLLLFARAGSERNDCAPCWQFSAFVPS